MDLKDLREKIDKLDATILELVNQRAKHALEVGEQKKQVGRPVLDKSREDSILTNLKRLNPGPLSNDSVEIIFKKIIEENRGLEQEHSKVI